MTPLDKYAAAKAFYLDNLSATEVSPHTARNYESTIRRFCDFWQQTTGAAADPTIKDVIAWRDELIKKGTSPATVRQYLVNLECFYSTITDRTLGEMRFYSRNIVSKKLYPKIKKRPYDEILTNDQAAKLFALPDEDRARGTNRLRNYAIIILLLSTGIRNSELLDLDLAHVDLHNRLLTVESGKGGKFRTVDLPEIAVSALTAYLRSGIRPLDAPDDLPLFGTTCPKGWQSINKADPETSRKSVVPFHRGTSQWLSALVERHVYDVTGVKNVRTHDLRHVFARLQLRSGVSLELLQGELGHSNPSTTQIYSDRLTARKQMEDARAVFAAAAAANESIKKIVSSMC